MRPPSKISCRFFEKKQQTPPKNLENAPKMGYGLLLRCKGGTLSLKVCPQFVTQIYEHVARKTCHQTLKKKVVNKKTGVGPLWLQKTPGEWPPGPWQRRDEKGVRGWGCEQSPRLLSRRGRLAQAGLNKGRDPRAPKGQATAEARQWRGRRRGLLGGPSGKWQMSGGFAQVQADVCTTSRRGVDLSPSLGREGF